MTRDELAQWLSDATPKLPHLRRVALALIDHHDQESLWRGAPSSMFSLAAHAYHVMQQETSRPAVDTERRELDRVRLRLRELRQAILDASRLGGAGRVGVLTGRDGNALCELGWHPEERPPVVGYRLSVAEVLDAAEKMLDDAEARPVMPLVPRQRKRPRERAFASACVILADQWKVALSPSRLAAMTNAVLRLDADDEVGASWAARIMRERRSST